MAGEYTITPDASRRFVRTVFSGFWSVATVESYVRDRAAIVAGLRRAGIAFAECVLLTDARAMAAQPLDSVAAFGRLVGGSPDQPRLSALVVTSALFNLQGQRMAIPRQRIFSDLDEALSWLGVAGQAITHQRTATRVHTPADGDGRSPPIAAAVQKRLTVGAVCSTF